MTSMDNSHRLYDTVLPHIKTVIYYCQEKKLYQVVLTELKRIESLRKKVNFLG